MNLKMSVVALCIGASMLGSGASATAMLPNAKKPTRAPQTTPPPPSAPHKSDAQKPEPPK